MPSPSRRRCRQPALRSRRAVAMTSIPTLALTLALLFPMLAKVVVQSIHLDIHVPLPPGCLKYHALLANRLLRQASRRSSTSNNPRLLQSNSDTNGDEEEATTQPSEEVDLFSDHTPHVTLYLADFDLEMEVDADEQAKKAGNTNNNSNSTETTPAPVAVVALNQTKVDDFLSTISSLNFTQIMEGLNCPLSFSADPSSSSSTNNAAYYNINGYYTMLPVTNTPCLQTLSTALLNSLSSYLRMPVTVPAWVASLPEPARSAAIYRSRTYGSPNVLEGFDPHVTVGYDPTTTVGGGGSVGDSADPSPSVSGSVHDPSPFLTVHGSSHASIRGSTDGAKQLPLKDQSKGMSNLQWRIDSMTQWNEAYTKVRDTCVDEVQGIALGKTGVGGTVLADGRMGYWDLDNDAAGTPDVVDDADDDEYYAVVE